MVDEVRGTVLIELARQLAGEGKIAESRETALQAMRVSGFIELAVESLTLGADINEVARRLPDLSDVDDFVEDNRRSLEPDAVVRWVNWAKIAAATNPQAIESVLQKIRGVGWYRNWLRFVVALAQAEAQSATDPLGAQASIVRAFSDLSVDTRPFAGVNR